MFWSIIQHVWLGFVRSDFFHKGLMVKVLVLFTLFVAAIFTFNFGMRLPAILLEHFPQHQPGGWVYSALFYIMVLDMIMRIARQKLPMAYFRPYSHLAVPRWKPSCIWLIRAILHPLNVFLLVFFWPFITQTINPELSNQGLGILGIFLLLLLNHSIYIYIKTAFQARLLAGKIIGLICLVIVALSIIYVDAVMAMSLNMFLGFVNGNHLLFIVLVGLIILLQALTLLNLKSSSFNIQQNNLKGITLFDNNRKSFFVSSLHPVYGLYWWLEWQLLLRNRRSRSNFWKTPIIGIAITLKFVLTDVELDFIHATVILMFAGGYGASHLQNALSWESHFFDFLATRDINFRDFLISKYYFYLFFTTLQFLLLVPVMAYFNPSILIYYMAVYLYMCGVGYYVLIRLGVNISCRLDPNGQSSFNYESLKDKTFLIIMLLYLSIIPYFLLDLLIDIPNIGMWAMAIVGATAILLHKMLINGIAQRLEDQKHRNLNIYRSR